MWRELQFGCPRNPSAMREEEFLPVWLYGFTTSARDAPEVVKQVSNGLLILSPDGNCTPGLSPNFTGIVGFNSETLKHIHFVQEILIIMRYTHWREAVVICTAMETWVNKKTYPTDFTSTNLYMRPCNIYIYICCRVEPPGVKNIYLYLFIYLERGRPPCQQIGLM